MRYITKRQWHEWFIYAVLWSVVFMAPAVDMYLKASANASFEFRWSDVREVWSNVLPFFVLFLFHNLLLAPRLLLRRKTAVYIVSIVCVLVVFQLLQKYDRWEKISRLRTPQQQEFRQFPPQLPGGFTPSIDELESISKSKGGLSFRRNDRRENPTPHFRPWVLFYPDSVRLVIAVLMLGLNIAVKLLFKSQRDEEVLKELEHQHLQQELEYLKYQINPHFFMNTLNNIHALVDIDAKKAKDTILELSRLMRYVLYEGSNRTIPLVREVKFLQHYIALMRLRYTDKVHIEENITQEIPGEVQVPPLLFISFVENAFKHGISYQAASFIRVAVRLEGNEVFFRCSNSRHAKNGDPNSGIGLENVRKRLRLLYGNGYYLNIDGKSETFDVLLVIPLTT